MRPMAPTDILVPTKEMASKCRCNKDPLDLACLLAGLK